MRLFRFIMTHKLPGRSSTKIEVSFRTENIEAAKEKAVKIIEEQRKKYSPATITVEELVMIVAWSESDIAFWRKS